MNPSPPSSWWRHIQTPFVLLVMAGLLAVWWLSRPYVLGARLFPSVVAGLGLALGLLELARQVRTLGAREEQDFSDLGDDGKESGTYARSLRYFAWLAGFMGLFMLIGVLPATALFVVAFLRLQHGESWRLSMATAISLTLVLAALGHLLRLRWPSPWLF